MVWQEIVSAVCICLSAAIFSISLQGRRKLTILFVQFFASALYLASYLFVIKIASSATIGAITASCEILRLVVFFFIERSKKFNNTAVNLTAGIMFCVVLTICTAFAWCGWISVFPLIGAVLVSLALGSKNVILIKLAFIVQAACIITYLCLLELWLNAASQAFVFVFGIVGLVVMLVKNKKIKVENETKVINDSKE